MTGVRPNILVTSAHLSNLTPKPMSTTCCLCTEAQAVFGRTIYCRFCVDVSFVCLVATQSAAKLPDQRLASLEPPVRGFPRLGGIRHQVGVSMFHSRSAARLKVLRFCSSVCRSISRSMVVLCTRVSVVSNNGYCGWSCKILEGTCLEPTAYMYLASSSTKCRL